MRKSKKKIQVEQPEIQVEQPEIQVEQPEIQVEQPEIQVEQPEIQVEQPEIQVEQPEIQVEQPEIQVEQPEIQVEQTEDPEQVLNDTLKKFSQNKQAENIENVTTTENINTTVEKVDIKLSDFITGYTLLVIYDRIYPKLLRYILKLLFKINIPQVSLDEDEAAILEPIADKIAEQMTVKVNPFAALFVLSNIFYLNKMDEAGVFESKPLKPKINNGKKRGRPRKNKNSVEQIKGE